MLAVLMLGGCASPTGANWYAPATWFSHRPADVVDSAHKKQTDAEDKALRAAQVATHETAEALAVAPDSRPVAVAKRSNATALRLLDQVNGALDVQTAAATSRLVADLLSENAQIRDAAERARAKDEAKVADLSKDLGAAQAAVAKAEGKLREAFERENALANELRSQRALFWIACGLVALVSAGWLYLKLTIGGVPAAAGLFMRDLRQKHPEVAKNAEVLFDQYLSRAEQRIVSKFAQ